LQVTLGNGSNLIAALPRDAEFGRDAAVGLTFDATEAHIFSA
jgi:hypothetical protein